MSQRGTLVFTAYERGILWRGSNGHLYIENIKNPIWKFQANLDIEDVYFSSGYKVQLTDKHKHSKGLLLISFQKINPPAANYHSECCIRACQ